MRNDLLLAAGHHVLALALVGLLAAELALLLTRPAAFERTLLRIDAAYGACALLLLAVGASRLAWGARPAVYYLHAPWFWAKLGAFASIGLLSILPTLALLRWRWRRRADPAFAPARADVRRVGRVVVAELALLVPVVVAAAAMARPGL